MLNNKELKVFLSEQGFDVNETDFLVSKNKNGIDDDGYPYLKQSIIIIPVNMVVEMTIYHYKEWDFYINDTIANEEDVVKNYTK